MKRIFLIAGAVWFGLALSALADVPKLINLQGVLRDGSGNPVANSSYSVMFRIYDNPTAGNVVWSESTSVSTTSGLFSVLLGSLNPVPDSAFNDSNRWLGIKVGADAEMSPRQKLASVGYTFRTEQWTSAGANLFRLNGNVGIGTASPDKALVVRAATGQHAMHWENNSFALGVLGISTDDNSGLLALASSGVNNIILRANGNSSFTGGNVGIGTAYPVSSRLRVYDDGSNSYAAIDGRTTATNGNGIVGEAYGADATGIWGINSSGNAGAFSGNVLVVGTLSKTAGGFKIDHPLDPADKYLYHSFVESPDMKNIYDGVAVTDARGNATVTLPDWFGALNKDFRYQLTAIGQFAQAIISKKIENNRFSIQTDKPNVEVSWQVTGIRQDAYANAHRIPVEELKQDKERGYYLHPELFGQPEEKGVEWAHRPEMMKEMKERRLQAEKEQK